MKICKKIAALALSAAAVLAIGTGSAFAAQAMNSADQTDPIIESAGYDPKSGLGTVCRVYVGEAALQMMEEWRNEGSTVPYAEINQDELVPVSEEETVEGDYRYVTRVYMPEIAAYSSAEGNRVPITAEMVVYNEATQSSTKLFKLGVGGLFSWSQSENKVYVESVTEPTITRYIFQEYPKLRLTGCQYNSNQGGFIGSKYAYIKGIVEMEKSAGKISECSLQLDVNVKGEIKITRKPLDYAYED